MEFYVSSNPDRLGERVNADTPKGAVAVWVEGGAAPEADVATVRWDVHRNDSKRGWWLCSVTQVELDAGGASKKAEPKKAAAKQEAPKKAAEKQEAPKQAEAAKEAPKQAEAAKEAPKQAEAAAKKGGSASKAKAKAKAKSKKSAARKRTKKKGDDA